MKKLILALLAVCSAMAEGEAKDKLKFDFYGRIRADLFYNSRSCNETVDGLFFYYPKDHAWDAAGQDLNATPQGQMYMLYSRAGVDVSGVRLGSAKVSAKLEADFRGNGTNYAVVRLRHAYVNLAWDKSQLLIGQTWHPLFGEVSPSVLNLNTGSPFQPFNRAPQIRYRYLAGRMQLTAATLWQMQFTSMGPNGKSHEYLKNACVPELFIGFDFKSAHWLAGIGAEMMRLRPRKTAQIDGKTYKVSEHVTSYSAEAHVKYADRDLQVSAKGVYASNLTQCSMLGGFGVTSVNADNGECSYAPFRNVAAWVNAVYGRKWQVGAFVGAMKNLGTGKEIKGETYGTGLDVDRLLSASAQLSYNLPHWKIGVEAGPTWAWYGTMDSKDGKVTDAHSVANWRVLASVAFIF